jgi:lipopolysaccharide export system permease protein
MLNYQTITKYLAKVYIWQLIITSGTIICILFVTNAFDILQKFKSVELSPRDFWQLILFKVPYLFCEVSSLCCFIATILFLRNITKQNELIIVLSSGIPIWRIFIIPISVTFIFGIIILSTINPIGTYGLKEYEKIEAKVTNTPHLNFVISQTGIFFFEKFAGDNRIIQAKSINTKEKILSDVTVLMVDSQNNLTKRIDSPIAHIHPGSFILENATITLKESAENNEKVNLPTSLSISNLIETFTAPEMIPIWSLKETIEKFAKSGLAITKYQIHYYKQLFKPISMVAMAFIACWFISLNVRDNSGTRTIVSGLILGICVYFFLEMTLRILAYSGVHPVLSASLPILFIILLSNFVILHFQEA